MDTDGEEFERTIALMFTVGSEGSYEWLVTDEDFDLLKLCPEIVVGKYVAVTSIDSSQLIPTDKETAAGWQSRARIAYLPSTTALCPWGCPLLLEHNKAPENCLIAAIASTSASVPCLQAHRSTIPPHARPTENPLDSPRVKTKEETGETLRELFHRVHGVGFTTAPVFDFCHQSRAGRRPGRCRRTWVIVGDGGWIPRIRIRGRR